MPACNIASPQLCVFLFEPKCAHWSHPLGVVSDSSMTDKQCHKHLWSFSDCPIPLDASKYANTLFAVDNSVDVQQHVTKGSKISLHAPRPPYRWARPLIGSSIADGEDENAGNCRLIRRQFW